MSTYPAYCVAIRTLGKAGAVFTDMIRSLQQQEHPPKAIFVYIPEGYSQPEVPEGVTYVISPKGMVHQRALQYAEIDTDYILFCDDDVFLPPHAVQVLFDALAQRQADCIAPNVFPNHLWPLKKKVLMALLGTLPSCCARYAFRIRKSSYYSYALHPKDVMPTQSFAGPCFLAKKEAFLQAHLEEECWMDGFPYPLGEDQMLAHKMYLGGSSLLIHYGSGIQHRDAKSAHPDQSRERFYNNSILRYAVWYRSIYQTSQSRIEALHAVLSFYGVWLWLFVLSLLLWVLRIRPYMPEASIAALKAAKAFVASDDFRQLPVWQNRRRP